MENQEEANVQQEQLQDPIVEAKISEPEQNEDPNVIKVDLRNLETNTDAVQEQSTDDSDVVIEQPENETSGQEVVEEVREPEQNEESSANDGGEESVLEEIIEEEISEETVQEEAQELAGEVEEAIQEQQDSGIELPENIQKVVDFMNETGGTLEDYVALNRDYSNVDDIALLRDYYKQTKPHLDAEDIDLLMEDFSYDEEIDDEKQIRKAKIAFKEEVAKAKNHLETLKGQYYEEIKAGSRLTPDQQKAIDFFNRYNKETEEVSKVTEQNKSIFKNKTNEVFSDSFKGFEYNVGDKKYRFNIKNANEVKEAQSDINNFVQKFLDEKNTMKDAKGYHKALFTAMNTDKIAQHFYEQGRADALKESISKSKNVNMNPRGVHEKVTSSSGLTVKAISGDSSSRLRVKIRK